MPATVAFRMNASLGAKTRVSDRTDSMPAMIAPRCSYG